MKTFDLTHYKLLLKVFLSDYIFSPKGKSKRKNSALNLDGEKEKTKKILGAIGAVLVTVLLIAYLLVIVSTLTKNAVSNGNFEIVPYSIIGIGQLFILFLGMGITFNSLYFSKDNELLLSLPLSGVTVFLAKFSAVYIAQTVVAVCYYIPSLITAGVTASMLGAKLTAAFYILSVFTPFLAILFPLLAVTLLSVPVMFLISFAKNRDLIKNIISVVVSLGFVALYFAITFSMETSGEAVQIPAIIGIAKFSVFNYNWVEAMLGNSIAINVLIYVAIIIVALALIILLSALTYRKSLSFSLEKGRKKNSRVRKSKNAPALSGKIRKVLFTKDLKTIIAEPTLLISMLMGIVIVPIVSVVSGKYIFAETFDNVYSQDLFSIGFISYLAFLMMGSANYSSIVGISLEGKNIALLKSLPIDCKDIIKGKLSVSILYCGIISTELFVALACTSNLKYGALTSFLLAVILFLGGFASSCFGLYSDLKKPNFKWENMQQLTKNNKKLFSRMIVNLALGFSFMIVSIVAGLVFAEKPLIAYLFFFLFLTAACVSFSVVALQKLWKNKEELFDAIEC